MKPKFIGKAKLTKQGQVTLPTEARKDLGLDSEAEIFWYVVDNHLVALKDLTSIEDLQKKLKRGNK